jgi:hypothetical protein
MFYLVPFYLLQSPHHRHNRATANSCNGRNTPRSNFPRSIYSRKGMTGLEGCTKIHPLPFCREKSAPLPFRREKCDPPTLSSTPKLAVLPIPPPYPTIGTKGRGCRTFSGKRVRGYFFFSRREKNCLHLGSFGALLRLKR